VVDPGQDACVAVGQTVYVGFLVFGQEQPPPEFRREGAIEFNRAFTYLLPFLPAETAGPNSPLGRSFASVTQIIESGGSERSVWERMLGTYEEYGPVIDSLLDPLIDQCPDLAAWYPRDASGFVIDQLRNIIATAD
jgi:hypothetical protein